MNYYRVEKSLQVILQDHLPLSSSQIKRIHKICAAVLLAGHSHFPKIARWLKQPIQHPSRIQWLKRTLQASYLDPEWVYYPLIKQALVCYQPPCLHVVMDRTPLNPPHTDLLSLSLNYRKRAVPLTWQVIAHGSSQLDQQKSLIDRCLALLPAQRQVVFHGDNEFGSVALMRHLQRCQWQFILGQSAKNCFVPVGQDTWRTLATLPVTRTQAVYCSDIELTKRHRFGPLNLFAFYKPRPPKRRATHSDVAYCATSLPITPTLRRLGRRRWGIECCFKDFKSAGWQLDCSHLTLGSRATGLITVLSVLYLWMTCLGRWLCKTSQRFLVDQHAQRHLSLFRLGWDWIVSQFRNDLLCPALLTLYS